MCDCTHEEKMNCEFSLLWQPGPPYLGSTLSHWRQPFLFSTETSILCKFFGVVLCKKTYLLNNFRLYLEITLFCATPLDKSFRVTWQTLKCYDLFSLLHHGTIDLKAQSLKICLKYVEVLVWSQLVLKYTYHKNALSQILVSWIKYFIKPQNMWGVQVGSLVDAMVALFCEMLPH